MGPSLFRVMHFTKCAPSSLRKLSKRVRLLFFGVTIFSFGILRGNTNRITFLLFFLDQSVWLLCNVHHHHGYEANSVCCAYKSAPAIGVEQVTVPPGPENSQDHPSTKSDNKGEPKNGFWRFDCSYPHLI